MVPLRPPSPSSQHPDTVFYFISGSKNDVVARGCSSLADAARARECRHGLALPETWPIHSCLSLDDHSPPVTGHTPPATVASSPMDAQQLCDCVGLFGWPDLPVFGQDIPAIGRLHHYSPTQALFAGFRRGIKRPAHAPFRSVRLGIVSFLFVQV